MHDDEDSDGGVEGGPWDGLGPDDEPTVVIVPRPTRDQVSRGLRFLGTAFKELRRAVFELSDLIDERTRLGAIDLSPSEVAEVDGYLFDAETRIKGIRGSLKRATGPQPNNEP